MVSIRLKELLVVGTLMMITVCFFFPVLSAKFINWDDDTHLTANPTVIHFSPLNFKQIFFSTVNETYIPLTILSFGIEHFFFGLNPFVYHFNNLVLHGLVGILIYTIGRQLSLTSLAAFVAAVFFIVHPLRVESVAWITERKDVLYSFFYLLSIYCYIRYLQQETGKDYILSLIAASLSILAKPMALSLPLVLLCFDYLLKRPYSKKIWVEKIPFFLVIVPMALITYLLNARLPIRDITEAPLIWAWTFAFYLKQFSFPIELTPVYSLTKPVHWLSFEYLLALMIMISFWCVFIFNLKRNRWISFAQMFFFCSIFFLLRFDDRIDNHLVADRFMYLPSVGFCWLLGIGVNNLFNICRHPSIEFSWQKRFAAVISYVHQQWLARILFVGFWVILGVLSVKTYQQTKIWQDSISFWNHVIEHKKDMVSAYNYRGVAYLDRHDLTKALDDFNQAILLKPDYIKAYYNKAVCYRLLKRYQDAIENLNQALTFDPHCQRCLNLYQLIIKSTPHQPRD